MTQLQPVDIFGIDIFQHLTEKLSQAGNSYLVGWGGLQKVYELSNDIKQKFLPGNIFYTVVDESQTAAKRYTDAFRSYYYPSLSRSVLYELNRVTSQTVDCIIYSGTGIAVQDTEETIGDNVAKFLPYQIFQRTDAFDSRDAQTRYILKFLPPHLKDSPSGKLLLDRAWTWLRGRYSLCRPKQPSLIFLPRHRFTASFVAFLIKNSFLSPHQVLDEYVLALTDVNPEDAPECARCEPDVDRKLIHLMQGHELLDITSISEGMLSATLKLHLTHILIPSRPHYIHLLGVPTPSPI
jgi:hypothetical protein